METGLTKGLETGLAVKEPARKEVAKTLNWFDGDAFNAAQKSAMALVHSDLVPESYKISATNTKEKAIGNCLIAMDMAARLGANPLMVMQNMAIVHGKPAWSSTFLIATVNKCGRFEPLKFKFVEKGMLGKVDYTDYIYDPNLRRKNAVTRSFDGSKVMDVECIAYTRERGSGEVLESSPVSVRMALVEGWYLKAGSKWQTMPRQMLMYRAASFWTKVYAPELSMGMQTEEEIRDIVDVRYEDITEKVAAEKAEEANKEVVGFNTVAVVEEVTGEAPSPAKEAADEAGKWYAKQIDEARGKPGQETAKEVFEAAHTAEMAKRATAKAVSKETPAEPKKQPYRSGIDGLPF
jgi:hypothetical protein